MAAQIQCTGGGGRAGDHFRAIWYLRWCLSLAAPSSVQSVHSSGQIPQRSLHQALPQYQSDDFHDRTGRTQDPSPRYVAIRCTYLDGSSVYRNRTGCVFALEGAVNDDYVWASVLLECECEDHAGGTCADDEDLCGCGEGHGEGGV